MIAENLARALGGRRTGSVWMARCPVHDDREPSLAIQDAKDGKLLVHCHAGCDQRQVVATLRSRGLWPNNKRFARHAPRIVANDCSKPDETNRTNVALAIWQAATRADHTLVETYLVGRGLRLPPPATLRFHAGLKHQSNGVWPAMIALVTGANGMPLAIHRTFLSRDGTTKAPVDPWCRGGAVWLAEPSDVLMVGEGIETCLSAMQATGNPAWAALSTSGLRNLALPDDVRDVIVLADGDGPGEAAAQDCTRRWKGQSRRVDIARPPQGLDFNDMLLGRTRHKDSAQ